MPLSKIILLTFYLFFVVLLFCQFQLDFALQYRSRFGCKRSGRLKRLSSICQDNYFPSGKSLRNLENAIRRNKLRLDISYIVKNEERKMVDLPDGNH